VASVVDGMKKAGIGEVPVVVGGIIPPEDAAQMKAAGVAAVYTPKDFDLNAIMADIVAIVERGARRAA
jgi:(2R)-ethylmalonyl-CoA mutase